VHTPAPETSSGSLRWQGGVSMRHDGVRRLGNLYLTEDAVLFIEAGRPPDDRLGGAGALLGIAVMTAIIAMAIEGSSRAIMIDGMTWAPRLAQIAAVLATVAMTVLAVVVASRSRGRARQDLLRLGGSEEDLELTVIEQMVHAIAGSFRLPVADIEQLELVGERELLIVTRLDERYLMMVVPERTRFLERLAEAGVRPS
jgi:hypothetical protein